MSMLETFRKQKSLLKNFVTRKGDKLMDGSNEFRFISCNIPNLHMNEDPKWHFPDPWEQEDAIKSIAQMGGQVVRTYVLSVSGGNNNSAGVNRSHIISPGVFDEEMFRCLDKTLELANKHGVRVIVPFVDEWLHWGGVESYCAFRGKKHEEFYTDPQLRDDFKATINYLLNRTNYYTGVKYKDDKAILCWETGNELRNPTDEWVADIAAYIKKLDKNHLVMDGDCNIKKSSLENNDIDMVTNHYYPNNNNPNQISFAQQCNYDRSITKGKKPFIVGEYGFVDFENLKKMNQTAIDNGTAGTLIWSLRHRNKDGGYYTHHGGNENTLHWPGSPENEHYREKDIVHMLREHAYKIRNLQMPKLAKPDAPVLFKIANHKNITWRGSTGAALYNIERANTKNGPWKIIGENISDFKRERPFFIDSTANASNTYYYRVIAKNESGFSKPSNVDKSRR